MTPISFITVALICTHLLQCCSAVPVWMEDHPDSLNNKEEWLHKRETRNTPRAHDFAVSSFRSLKRWDEKNCNIDNQCETVSSHWCDSELQKKMFCAQEGYFNGSRYCSLNFQLEVFNKNASISGLDINLYKNSDNEDHYYDVLILSTVQPYLLDVVSSQIIHSNCSGWQMFHISPKKVKSLEETLASYSSMDSSTGGSYTLNVSMSIIVFVNDENHTYERTLSCDEIASLFVLDKTPITRRQELNSNSFDAEDKNDDSSSTQFESKAKTKPTGSGEIVSSDKAVENSNNDSSTPSENEEQEEEVLDLELLVPIATLFVDDLDPLHFLLRGKRDINEEPSGVPTSMTDDELCELQERNATFDDPTIIAPPSFTQRHCVTPPSLQSQGLRCVPSTYESMDVLRRHQGRTSIDLIPQAVVSSCKIVTNPALPTCELQERVVVLQEHFNTSIIVAPETADIHQCVLSPSANSDSEEFQCVPASYTGLYVVLNLGTEFYLYIVENVTITSCKLVTKDQELLVVTEESKEPITTILPPKNEKTEKEEVEKTTAITSTTDKSNNACELRDKIVDLQEYIHPSILEPRHVNIKECAFASSTSNNDTKCIPASYNALHVVLRNSLNHTQIELLPNIVVKSCKVVTVATKTDEDDKNDKTGEKDNEPEDINNEPTSSAVTCELQDRVVNVSQYLNDSSIVAPQTFNIHQCSPSTNEQCPECKPEYGRLEVLKLDSYGDQTIISTIPDVIVINCKKNPHC